VVYLLAGLIFITAFAVAGLLGAPYLPILKRDSVALLKLAKLGAGDTIIDLGSGDGRLLRDAAKQGVRGIGYEINPFMVLVSRIVCWRYRKLVTIHLADFWQVKLPPADVIYVFLIPRFMEKLDRHLAAQIKKPTRLISYAFEIPTRKPSHRTFNTFVYDYSSPES
jgi:SAM-dependent methyltransferase